MDGVLTRRSDFLRVYQRHTRVSARLFVLLVHPCRTETPGAGLVVSRKVGKAVRRNLVKRRLRACLREHREQLSLQRDMIIIARPGAAEVDWPTFCRELTKAFDRARQAFAVDDAAT